MFPVRDPPGGPAAPRRPEPPPGASVFGVNPGGGLPMKTTLDPGAGISNRTLAVYQKPPRRGRIHMIGLLYRLYPQLRMPRFSPGAGILICSNVTESLTGRFGVISTAD